MRAIRWRHAAAGALILAAAIVGPQTGLAQETTVANNLSIPTIFVPSVGVGSMACTAADDTVLPDPAQVSSTYPGYWVQGEATWQADCDVAADNTMTATAAWGDNLAGSASLKVGSPARVELALLADPTAYSMTGFTVVKLQPELEDRDSAYGTADGSGVTPFSEVGVWDAGVTLNITGPATESVAFTAELNATGRVVYGYNWRPAVAGTYTLTATVPTVEVTGTDLGTFAAHTATIAVVVADSSGGGGGGGGGGESNTAPVAVDDSFTVTSNTTSNSLAVLANDTDADGDALTVAGIGSLQGTATIASDAKSIVYTPKSGFVGTESFTYTVSDGALTDIGNVTVTVAAASGGGTTPPPSDGGGTTPPATGGTTPPATGGGVAVPVPGQGGAGSTIDATLDPATDATLVDGEQTLVATSADGHVKISIPIKGLKSQGSIHVLTTSVDLETALAHPLHHPVQGLLSIGGTTYDIQVLDSSGTAVTSFDEDIAISVQIDPASSNLDRVQVLRWDETAGWVKVPTTVADDGTVTFTTNHLSLYALFELPATARVLGGGLNYLTFTGADGTTPQQFAAQFQNQLETMFRFNAETQMLESYIPGAPAVVQTLTQLRSRDVVIVRLRDGAQIQYEATDVVPPASGLRQQTLRAGLNAIGVTANRAMGPARAVPAAG